MPDPVGSGVSPRAYRRLRACYRLGVATAKPCVYKKTHPCATAMYERRGVGVAVRRPRVMAVCFD